MKHILLIFADEKNAVHVKYSSAKQGCVTDNIIFPGILINYRYIYNHSSLAIIVLFINTVLYIVLNTVIGEKVARCNAVIATATRDENFNKDILLGNKDILYFKTVFQYSFCYGIIKQKE